MTDYELAQLRAFRHIFPNSQMIGCLYHYMAVCNCFLCDIQINWHAIVV